MGVGVGVGVGAGVCMGMGVGMCVSLGMGMGIGVGVNVDVKWCKFQQIAMMQQPATNYKGCQRMLLLFHRGQPEGWRQCSKIGSMSSYPESAHYPDCTW